jgi:hypothetical protein
MENNKKKTQVISTEEFDRRFEAGEDMSEHIDWNNAIKKVNLDIPVWAIKAIDEEAKRRGIARQALIKMWLIDRVDALKSELRPSADDVVANTLSHIILGGRPKVTIGPKTRSAVADLSDHERAVIGKSLSDAAKERKGKPITKAAGANNIRKNVHTHLKRSPK